MPEPPYPTGEDYRIRELERRVDRNEQRIDTMNFGRLEDKVGVVQRDVERVERKLDQHIESVKPLISSDASRTGVSALLRWVIPILVAGIFALANVLIATGALH